MKLFSFSRKKRGLKNIDYKQALTEFNRSLTLIVDQEQLKSNIVSKINEILQADKILIYFLNPDLNRFELLEARGVNFNDYKKFYFTNKQKLLSWLMINETYLLISEHKEVLNFIDVSEKRVLEQMNIDLVYPLKVMNQVKGIVFLGKKQSGKEFLKEELNLLTTFIDQAAFAFGNSLLQQQQRERIKRMYRADRLTIMGQLAAGAAHEIRNPLTSIRSTIQYIQKDLKNPEKNKMAKELISEVDRINEIIQGLLSFAKPDKLKVEKVNLELLLKQIETLIHNHVKKQGAEIIINFNSPIKDTLADPSQLKQVFFNIILNSLQAIQKNGKIEINVNLMEETDDASLQNRMFVITITDNGKGISQKDIDHIFDPFFTTKKDGTGLGLSITYGIIQQHNGEIEVESKIGKETKVKILLPVKI